MKLVGVIRTLLTVLRRNERSRRKLSMNARYEMSFALLIFCFFFFNLKKFQVAAIKLRQKAITDSSASFEKLTQLGY